MARATWADHPERDSVMVREVLLRPVPWSSTVIFSRSHQEVGSSPLGRQKSLLVLVHFVSQ
ncbi:hypothetical protein TIFTF001_030793 [Ficus carica]|uniref:Uncharacterized protein n=1 Tax=Ficus carica TaxID=3494 RepID=A0AA88J4M1_FICCA|nr:hypothetical protein TIFTF001_030793 [Ficus carica]